MRQKILWTAVLLLFLCSACGTPAGTGSESSPGTVSAGSAQEGGVCGASLTWSYQDNVLTVTGTGNMTEYRSQEELPWYSLIDQIGKVAIDEGCTEISDAAFSGYPNLSSVILPDSVTLIGREAFSQNNNLASVSLGSGLTSIGEQAFQDCGALTEIALPDSLTEIGEDAFSGCMALTSVSIPNGVTVLEERVFANCLDLTSVSLPDGITTLKGDVFTNCQNLASVTIPQSVTAIAGNPFVLCENLVAIDNRSPNFILEDGVLFNRDKTELILCLTGKTGNYSIPDGVAEIAPLAFQFCKGITSVSMPDSVSQIGTAAFQRCTGLTSVTIPDNIAELDALVFAGCTDLILNISENTVIVNDTVLKRDRISVVLYTPDR